MPVQSCSGKCSEFSRVESPSGATECTPSMLQSDSTEFQIGIWPSPWASFACHCNCMQQCCIICRTHHLCGNNRRAQLLISVPSFAPQEPQSTKRSTGQPTRAILQQHVMAVLCHRSRALARFFTFDCLHHYPEAVRRHYCEI